MDRDLDNDREVLDLVAHVDTDYSRLSDVDEFVARTEDYAKGLLTSEQYRQYRLTRGVYGQRQDNVFMMRVKIPGGIVKPHQVRALAVLCDHTPDKLGHITTRENLQFHSMQMKDVERWMKHIAEAGLTMVDACGNAVRTVTQDPWAGLAPDEVFDTTPYLQAITRFFLRNPRSLGLPRKFKIALSTSAADRGFASIHDVGLVAVRGAATQEHPDGEPAFRMMVGGGLASMPRSGLVVHEAWPARDILTPMLAVIDFFQEHGNRKVRSKARIKHVLRKMGDAAFLAKYLEYLAVVQQEQRDGKCTAPRIDDVGTVFAARDVWTYARPTDDIARASGFAEWAATCVRETRLPGRVFVQVRLDRGGEVTPQNLNDLADLAESFGEGLLHFTPTQNALLRAVPVERLPELYGRLRSAGMARPNAGTVQDITSCPGISTCNLGVTFSRHLADDLVDVLAGRSDEDLTIKISGCHNSCGQHHIGTFGLFGALRRIGGRPAPHYRLMVGGGIHPHGAEFGDDLGLIPAKRTVEAIQRLLFHADVHRAEGETAGGYLRRVDKESLKPLIADLIDIPDDKAVEMDFWDIGATNAFLAETREGECAA